LTSGISDRWRSSTCLLTADEICEIIRNRRRPTLSSTGEAVRAELRDIRQPTRFQRGSPVAWQRLDSEINLRPPAPSSHSCGRMCGVELKKVYGDISVATVSGSEVSSILIQSYLAMVTSVVLQHTHSQARVLWMVVSVSRCNFVNLSVE